MTSIRYVATLPHVREVSIVGAADLGFWTDRLRAENLTPLEEGGRARLLLIAADSRYMGLRFQELSVSVLLGDRPGAFLVQAFNSRRSFAWFERNLFGTPYDFGDLRVTASLPASVRLTRGRELLFHARMGAGAAPSSPGSAPYEQGWDGPVFLPSRKGKRSGRLFFARVHGMAQSVPFEPSRDVLELRPGNDLPVFEALIDSRFSATHWLVRPDAVHAKSKTYSDRNASIGSILDARRAGM